MRKLPVTVAGLVLAASAGCSGSDKAKDVVAPAPAPSTTTTSGTPEKGPTTKAAVKVPEALRFKATTLDGRAFDGASLAGKPVVFWFWAPWCPKCISEGPDLAKVAKKYGDRVGFVGVAGLDGSKDRMRQFVSRTGTDGITHLDDRSGKLYAHFKVTSQSSYLFMKADGAGDRASGPLSERDLERHVERLTGG